MPEIKDDKLFPIMGERGERGCYYPKTFIPWWLAELAYEDYKKCGSNQSLKRIAERGGFGRGELINHLRRKVSNKKTVSQWDDWKPKS